MGKRKHKKSANINTKNTKNTRPSKLRVWVGSGMAVLVIVIIFAVTYMFGGDTGDEPHEPGTGDLILTGNPSGYVEGAMSGTYAAKAILVNFSDFDSREEARRFAEGIYQRASGGEDFDWLIRQYAGPATRPEGYRFTRGGSMIDEFEDAAVALEIGGIGLAETDFGIYIIKRIQPN